MSRRVSSPVRRAQSACVGNIPVGLCGALTTTSRVFDRSEPMRRSTSRLQPSASLSSWSVTSAPAAPADLVQALISGPGDDRVVVGPEDDVGEAEDRLLGAGEDEDVVR